MKRVIVFLLLCWASSVGAAGSVETLLKEVVAGSRPVSDVTITYTAGNPDFHGGETKLSIDGNGKAVLTWTEGKKTKKFTKAITPSGIQALFKTMFEDRYWTAKASTGGTTRDAATITIRVATAKKDTDHSLSFPYARAFEDKKTQTTVRIFQQLIRTISKGKVTS